MRDDAAAAETVRIPMLAHVSLETLDIHGRFDQTIRPDVEVGLPQGFSPVATLPMISLTEGDLEAQGKGHDLKVIGELGEGGMGVVKLARQRSLRRDVAIKLIKGGATAHAANALLREASLTGCLEHPNIIPIHALGLTPQGNPALVMKRIEGTSWRELIVDPDHPRRDLIKGDPLLWHVAVLIQVCKAVHFAHSRGVIHRDLKPENVMIGAFGEVYLLDWGVAMEMNAPQESAHVVGTPAYMAPEMTTGDPSKISPLTDVYLLGAVLHEILTGEPPHLGTNAYTVLLNAFHSTPHTFDESVPAPLAELRNLAMNADPRQRPRDAEALSEALRGFIQHREALKLEQEATKRLSTLRKALGAEQNDQDMEIHRLFGECRFGFQQAVEAWPDNVGAREGLIESTALMARFELDAGNARTAEILLHDLPDPDPALLAKLDALKASQAAEQTELVRLRELEQYIRSDMATGQRSVIVAVAAFFLAVLPLALAIMQALGVEGVGYKEIVIGGFVGAISLASVTFLFRRSLQGAWKNRSIIFTAVALFTCCLMLRGMAAWFGTPLHQEMIFEMMVMSYTVALLAVHIDKRLMIPAIIHATGLLPAAYFPGAALFILTACNSIALIALAVVWRGNLLESRPE